jgi:peroxiredoxin
VWESASSNEVQLDVGKPGYQWLRGYRLVASDKEVVITLRKPPRVYGTVVDAQSGKSIEKFRVLNGFKPNERYPITWDEHEAREAVNGQYEITFGDTQPMRAVRIEAAGYLPQVSRIIKGDEGNVQFDVKLKKGTGPAGIVKMPDGTPAVGAQLMLCTPFSQIPFRDGKIVERAQNSAYVVSSGEDGKFEFWPQLETFLIVAVHDGGFAKVSQEEFEKSAQIRLAPWGKVEGKLLIGSKPAAGHMIYLSHDRPHDETAPRFFAQYDGISDKEGNFVFDRVIPGDIQLTATMTPWNGTPTSSSNTLRSDATVRPGETVKVQLGGLGRPVVGRVNLPADLASKGWTVARAAFSTKQPETKYPQGWDNFTDEQQQEFWNKLSETAEWKKLQRKMRDYRLTIEKDGSFRINDVLPGTYVLDASIADAPSGKASWGLLAASVNKEITVGEIPGGKTDEPLDVGMLEVTRIKSVAVGDVVPEIPARTFDGKEFKLSGYRGKHVLVEFWSTRLARVEFAKMTEMYEAYGKDQRLVIVGFNFDRNIPAARQFAEANGMKWMQVFLGQKSTVAQEFQCQIWPSRWLIGPDGKVIARDIAGVRLKEEVAKAVGKGAQ